MSLRSLQNVRKTSIYNTYNITQTQRYSVRSEIILPTQARIVIAGGGVVANSVAYHLVKNGWSDVLILDQGRIGSGTSHFGSGTLGLFKPIADRNLILYSIKLYNKLQKMGYDIGIKQCGSLNLAQTKDRVIALRRRMAYNIPTGLHCELVSRKELQRLHPLLRVDDIEAAVWVPEDSVADPKKICNTLAELAEKGGAVFQEHCAVERVLTDNGTVKAVQTEHGTVHCEYFINCAGMWARELGLKCQIPVRIPAYPAEHFYAITTGLAVNENLPCIRDYDGFTYARALDKGLMVGWFEKEARPAFWDKKVPRDWKKHVQSNFQHFLPLWENAVHRLPILKSVSRPQLTNSPDNFTPDGRWILGETAEVNNYFVAVGMNGNSLQGAGGIGKAVAEWIIEGKPTQELLPFSVQRFLDLHNNRQYLQQRTKEVVGRHYAILYPHQCEYKYARKLRCSPLYIALESRGAVFGIKMAYERALYFDTSYKRGDKLPTMPPGSFFKPKFFDFMKQEYLACREGVGVIDMSSFSKIEIKSTSKSEVLNYLQQLCSNDVDIPVGSITHTGMQNERGGYENDCMLVRQDENNFFMVSPSSQQTRIYEWMSQNLPFKHSISLNDVTSMYTVINTVGPKASALLNELSSSELSLGPYRYRKCNIGYASDVMVMAFTHTGEPGYCLYVPSEYALHVYEKLITVGKDYGVRDVGTLAQRWMRIEKFIPFWAEELTSFTTPFEAGLDYTVKLQKEFFIGKDALVNQKKFGVKRRLVLFHLNDIDPESDIWPWGGEPLYRNDKYVGTVTSAGYGFQTDKLVCLGYICRGKEYDGEDKTISNEYIISKDAVYEVDIAGHRFKATPHIHPPALNNVPVQTTYKPKVVRYKSDIAA
ncbi:pyruvate dehydrogenase phosphatase regulatory subunit, mitochondrial-like [Chrysoperla carnea]|uniref:pyruvate dehydrogenase phosphatase regulatory subunit, mitochondrial-like n=1 Tax=Chrysoperla carnea TaxID=189513 RepID=UPI001D06A343|nr:pyruvate dehydrogenase phosphatase regulatory subunit, mitochondrial-like [Chrysoperla carnea]